MIKRAICLIIIFAMCLSFAACSNSCNGTSSSNSVVSQVTSEGSDEGDDSEQDSSSSVGGGAQEDEGALQSEGDDSSNSDSGSGSDNADDNSGSDSDSDTDGANNGSGSDNGGTTGTQTGAGSAQSGFAITKQPVSTSVAVGAPLTLSVSVSASGSGTLTYKWYTSLTNGYDGIEMLGKTSSTVSLSTSNPFTQYYYCVVTQTSTGATLTTNIAMASAVGNAATPTPVSYNLWIGGVQVTSANAANVLGDGTVNFNGATNTLTLNGATILYDGTADKRSPIHSGLNNLTINLNKTSTLQSTGGANEESDGSSRALDGIYSTGTISINGTGTLNTTGGDYHLRYGAAGNGIYALGGLTIYSGTINATGGDSSGTATSTGGAGIETPPDISVTIWGGTINATGGYGENSGGTGIDASDLYIYGASSISATGGKGENNGGNGTFIFKNITLGDANNPFNGSLTATGGAGDFAYGGNGILSNGNLYIYGNPSISATGGASDNTGGASDNSGGSGIHSDGNLYIYGNPSITATGGASDKTGGNGIHTVGNITLGNDSNKFSGLLTAIGGGGLPGGTAFYKDVTSYFFGADMNYYTSTNGTTWEDKGEATSLPNNHHDNFGLRFAPPTP